MKEFEVMSDLFSVNWINLCFSLARILLFIVNSDECLETIISCLDIEFKVVGC